jgi:hypothetical protein
MYSSEATKQFGYQVWQCTDITGPLITADFKTLTHFSSGQKLTIHVPPVKHICPLFSCPVLASQAVYIPYLNGADTMASKTISFNYSLVLTNIFQLKRNEVDGESTILRN